MEKKHGTSPFSLLPEGCISHILSLTCPRDICRASAVSRRFKSTSESDMVWELFLPCDYKEIISNSATLLSYSLTKREIFLHLRGLTIFLNGGRLSFWFSRSGRKCHILSARELSIEWEGFPSTWNWISIPESRFAEVAELAHSTWLDIRGRMQIKMLSLKANYAAHLVFKTAHGSLRLYESFEASVAFVQDSSCPCGGDDLYVFYRVYLMEYGYGGGDQRWRKIVKAVGRHFPRKRMDGWMEIYLGQFFNDNGNGYIDMQLWPWDRLMNIEKRGLII